eukprot:g4319.t1
MGIEPSLVKSSISRMIENPGIGGSLRKINRELGRNTNLGKIVVSVASVERLRGILLSLFSFETLLRTCPAWRNQRVIFIQFGLASVNENTSSNKDADEIKRIAQDINSRWAVKNKSFQQSRSGATMYESILQQINDGNVVIYIERAKLSIHERIALWCLGDIYLSTSLRDGLRLNSLEFVATKNQLCMLQNEKESNEAGHGGTFSVFRPGLVLVSEFAGCSRVLNGALRINPWNIEGPGSVVNNLDHALSMSRKELEARCHRDVKYLRKFTTTDWMFSVIEDLLSSAKKNHQRFGAKKRRHGSSSRNLSEFSGNVGFGLNMRITKFSNDSINLSGKGFVQHIDTILQSSMRENFRSSRRRLFLLDYRGTLVAGGVEYDEQTLKGGNKLAPAGVRTILQSLCKDMRNTVFIISGMTRRDMIRSFGEIKGLAMAAEHGAFYHFGDYRWQCYQSSDQDDIDEAEGRVARNRVSSFKDSDCDSRVSKQIQAYQASPWYGIASKIMDAYARRTNGSFVHRKESSVLWRYLASDTEFGEMQSKELVDHLSKLTEKFR